MLTLFLAGSKQEVGNKLAYLLVLINYSNFTRHMVGIWYAAVDNRVVKMTNK